MWKENKRYQEIPALNLEHEKKKLRRKFRKKKRILKKDIQRKD